jgi:glycosyltransferase involved in cell wall biosynthesis
MKSIFLLMKYYIDPEEHTPFPKFNYQIKALESMGYKVYYLGIERGNVYLCHKNNKEFIYKIRTTRVPGMGTLLIYDALYKSTVKLFKQKRKFNLAYIRAMPTMPSYPRAMKEIKKSNCKIVTEIPTHPIIKEIDNEKRFLRRFYFKLSNYYFVKMAKYTDLFALIGETANKFAGRKAINIENGIHLENIPIRKNDYNNKEIHLIGLANMAKWHGYDRLIEGLKQYKENGGKEHVVIHFVGPDADGSLKEWESLTREYGLEDCVFFEGSKFGEDLNWYFDKCQIAVGTLGLHRIGYSSATTLKAREYMARGIPFILSDSDQAIKSDSKFCKAIPSDDSPVDIESIIQFSKGLDEETSIVEQMRKFAEENMTWEKQFSKIFEQIGGGW